MLTLLPWVGAGLVVLLAIAVVSQWFFALVKVIFRACGGFLFLSLIQPIGLGIGANGLNALVLALLGAPGFGLLLMLQWVLG